MRFRGGSLGGARDIGRPLRDELEQHRGSLPGSLDAPFQRRRDLFGTRDSFAVAAESPRQLGVVAYDNGGPQPTRHIQHNEEITRQTEDI